MNIHESPKIDAFWKEAHMIVGLIGSDLSGLIRILVVDLEPHWRRASCEDRLGRAGGQQDNAVEFHP